MPVILRFLRVEGVGGGCSGLPRPIAPWAQGCVGLQGMDSLFLPEPSPASFAQSRHGPSCTFPLIAADSPLPSWSLSLPRRHREGTEFKGNTQDTSLYLSAPSPCRGVQGVVTTLRFNDHHSVMFSLSHRAAPATSWQTPWTCMGCCWLGTCSHVLTLSISFWLVLSLRSRSWSMHRFR